MDSRSKKKLILICLIAFAGLAFFYFQNLSEVKTSTNGEGIRFLKAQTFEQPGGWGYRILQDTTTVIEQPDIPGVTGKKPFKTEQQSQAIANLVLQKLNQGTFPPTITFGELDSLQIDYK